MRKTVLVAAATAILAAAPAVTANAAPGATDGTITVSVVSDGAPMPGVAVSLSAPSPCAIPVAGSTGADGSVTFTGLTPTCDYTAVPTAPEGYGVVAGDHTASGGVANPLTITTDYSVTGAKFQVARVNGVPTKRFDDIKAQCDTGWGTTEVRFGRNPFTDECFIPTPNDNQSGFSLNMGEAGTLSEGYNLLGSFVHHNRNIERGVDLLNAKWTYNFTDAAGNSESVNRWFGIVVDETFDLNAINGVGCTYDHPLNGNLAGGVGCVDKVNAWPYPSKTVTVGDAVIELRASLFPSNSGVCPATPSGGEIDANNAFFTAERTNTAFCFYAKASPVQTYSANAISVELSADVEPTPTPTPTPTVEPTPTPTVDPTPTPSQTVAEPTVTPTPTVTTIPETIKPTNTSEDTVTIVPKATATTKAPVVNTGGASDVRPMASAGAGDVSNITGTGYAIFLGLLFGSMIGVAGTRD